MSLSHIRIVYYYNLTELHTERNANAIMVQPREYYQRFYKRVPIVPTAIFITFSLLKL